MLEIARDLALIYAYSFVTGVGLFDLIVPQYLKRRYLVVILPAGIGLLQLAIVDGYLVAASVPVDRSLYVSGAIGVASLVASIVRSRGLLLGECAQAFRGILTVPGAVLLVLMCIVASPVVVAGLPTTPYRIGIDQVGYSETAQYLLEGGTIARLRATLSSELQTNDLRKAKAQNLKDLHFETYVDSEFLLKAFRWGFPGTIASLALLTQSANSLRVCFLILLISYALTLAVALYMLRQLLGLPLAVSLAIVSALALNCNLLNVYYEGQFAQVFAVPYFLLILVVAWFHARSRAPYASSAVRTSGERYRELLFPALLLGGLFAAYNESIVLLVGFAVLTVVIDLVVRLRTNVAAIVSLLIVFALGAVLMLPVSAQWFIYTFANLSGLSRAGFWQPHWGSLAEILGLFDMYRQPGYVLVDRAFVNEAANFIVSLLAILLCARFALRSRASDKSFWLAPLIIIGAAYYKMRILDDILNYPYMKIYTMLAPFVVCLVFAEFYRFVESRAALARSLAFVVAGCAALTGCAYVGQYLTQYHVVTRDMFSMSQAPERRLEHWAIYTPFRGSPSIADFMLTPLISMYWINEGDQKFVAPYLDRPVAVVLANGDLSCRECFLRKFAGRIAYQNDSYVVVDTGKKLRDFCVKQAADYRVDALSYDTTEVHWPGLPNPQCDYAYANTLPFVAPH